MDHKSGTASSDQITLNAFFSICRPFGHKLKPSESDWSAFHFALIHVQ